MTSMRHLQSGQATFDRQLIEWDTNCTKALGASVLSGFANVCEIREYED